MTMNKQNYNNSSVFKNISVLYLFSLKIIFVLKMATLDYNSGLNITEYFKNHILDCFTRKPSDSEKKKTAAVTPTAQHTRGGGATRLLPGNG